MSDFGCGLGSTQHLLEVHAKAFSSHGSFAGADSSGTPSWLFVIDSFSLNV